MKYLKKYRLFEDLEEEEEVQNQEATESETDSSDSKYSDIIDEVKSMIEKTIENSGGEFNSFIGEFKKNPEDVQIEGLINDSDIYDFYLKWRNDIDEILNDIKFFNESPTEINAFGLYEYLIKGTERCVLEVVEKL
jgi:hypothetical protein